MQCQSLTTVVIRVERSFSHLKIFSFIVSPKLLAISQHPKSTCPPKTRPNPFQTPLLHHRNHPKIANHRGTWRHNDSWTSYPRPRACHPRWFPTQLALVTRCVSRKVAGEMWLLTWGGTYRKTIERNLSTPSSTSTSTSLNGLDVALKHLGTREQKSAFFWNKHRLLRTSGSMD